MTALVACGFPERVEPGQISRAGSARRRSISPVVGVDSPCREKEGTPSMDPGTPQQGAQSADPATGDPDALDFVRFCYRRRHVGWPELYDEMCAVAGRGLYHGYCAEDLGRIGIGFALFEMPGLATIVHRVVAEDQERRRLSAQAVRTRYAADEAAMQAGPPEEVVSEVAQAEAPDIRPRLLAVPAGAI